MTAVERVGNFVVGEDAHSPLILVPLLLFLILTLLILTILTLSTAVIKSI